MPTKPKTGQRYSGQDSTSWTIKGSKGELESVDGKIIRTTSFVEAQGLALAHTKRTGDFALAVRV